MPSDVSAAAAVGAADDDATRAAQARALVEAFLSASMVPDPDTAAGYVADDVAITFTGGRRFSHPREPSAFNAKRYRWVKKQFGDFDVAVAADRVVVYSVGSLYGEWPDGTPFEGNRYVDRFVVVGDKIVQMDVWNDSAERLLTRHGIDA